MVPLLTRRGEEAAPEASSVDERYCTGCEQCYLDCPYEAIAMLERSEGPSRLVARVDPALCVSCGICAGSCAPMRVGPPERTGRDQLAAVRAFTDAHDLGPGDVVLVGCDRAAFSSPGAGLGDTIVYPVSCAGSVHTSTVEYLLRAGAGGVMIAACPPRDCWNREGAIWLEQRLYHDREAELQARVDRRRVRLVYAGSSERSRLRAELDAFRREIGALAATETAEEPFDLVRMCETAAEGAEG